MENIKLEFEAIPDYGDLMTLEHWIENVACGGFIDYDGHGDLATENKTSNLQVKPSFVSIDKKTLLRVRYPFSEEFFAITEEFMKENKLTHVVWYNR